MAHITLSTPFKVVSACRTEKAQEFAIYNIARSVDQSLKCLTTKQNLLCSPVLLRTLSNH